MVTPLSETGMAAAAWCEGPRGVDLLKSIVEVSSFTFVEAVFLVSAVAEEHCE